MIGPAILLGFTACMVASLTIMCGTGDVHLGWALLLVSGFGATVWAVSGAPGMDL